MLKRDEILSKNTLKKELVHVPEWGGDIFVSEMTASDRDEWEQRTFALKNRNENIKDARAKLVVATVVDDAGNRIFSWEDVPHVGKLSGEVLLKLCAVANRLNGLGSKSVEEESKNLEADPPEDSASN